MFTKRIVAFNMTFAPLGGKKGGKPLAIIWHEALCGRYVKFVEYFWRDHRDITLWVDNCSA